ncbi:30S ribosomal protein S6 [Desulfonema magnum]|uniref:Small ribosomal subunit protein bS6 n=1 Tax=Desulfonema magnum TaxID=45655 RepID=A0A975BK41_9BACT|nr:30S ribosomal protein S6 [Desulfonema magnum]QTA86843.1 30S ribosomal protein S6 [Desulfonema magnum]
MRRYETIFITDPDLSNEDRDPFFKKIKELISEQKGFLVMFDEWGTQKLAYEIKKKTRGHYVRLDYCGTGDLVLEIERICRIDDRSLKYMTVLLEDAVDVESLKKEMAEPETSEETPSDASPEAADTPEPEAADAPEPEAADTPEPEAADAPEPEAKA